VNPAKSRISLEELRELRRARVRIIAPPIFALLAVDSNDKIVPSQYARDIKSTGFDIITWSFERADLRRGAASAGFYYLFDPTGRAAHGCVRPPGHLATR
jgi:glycerophosphoryl diester phosphodiesterase